MDNTITKELKTPYTIQLNGDDPEAKRAEIRRYFHETYDAYELLFETLASEEAYYRRADLLRHPLIFYYGHTATFFVNKLLLGKFMDQRINPDFESTFAIGVDEMSWDDLNEQHYDWPAVKAVKKYRDQVRAAIDDLIDQTPVSLPVAWDSLYWIILMGTEHERIHLETSSVLIRQLPTDLLNPNHQDWSISTETDTPAPQNELIPVSGGTVTQSKDRDDELYGWDSEYGHHVSEVSDFQASKYLVSNREFLKFIEEGGYSNESYWTQEGWDWVLYKKAVAPQFWIPQEDGSFRFRSMLKAIDMPWSWPAETNYLEAKAFCNWKTEKTGLPIRLPSEEEWYRLLDFTKTPDVAEWEKTPGNLNLEDAASSVPVDKYAFEQGFYDVLGNVWQHTETPIRGLPGFQVHPLYDDFSTPTFDTKHNLIKGGSWISTGNEIIRSARYAFRRHFYQHAGFRYIASDAPIETPDDRYETDPEVIPYCELHYGKEYFGVENYPEKLAQIALNHAQGSPKGKALNIGCKTGRSAFELAVEFNSVIGVDFTARMIRIGVELKEKGYTQYTLPEEGEIVSFHQQNLQELGLDASRPKVEFLQSDISNMKSLFTGYDLILLDTMLENTYNPQKFLDNVHQRINSKGLLIIASSYDWQNDRTDREHWLGGFKINGENATTLNRLHELLEDRFTRISEPTDIQQVIRKTNRTFEHKVIQVTVWKLNG
jgi:5-histidylcysteine sulfoxide synthase/putative 4-mercaptohistidine N1-methyltranferase|tara:strand:+ start:4341 stop:6479 length:2139 start_codon:yes stop_codon:yes gene_type:complete